MNQAELAEIAGVTLQTQSRYEKATTEAGAMYFARVAAVGVDVGYVMTGTRTAGTLTADQSELLENFQAMPHLDQLVLLRLATSLSGLPPRPRPKLTEAKLQESLMHFLRVAPKDEIDQFDKELLESVNLNDLLSSRHIVKG